MTLITEYRPEFSPTGSSPTKPQQPEMGTQHLPNLSTNHSQSNYQLTNHQIPSTPMVNTGLGDQYSNIDYHYSSFQSYKVSKKKTTDKNSVIKP